MSARRLSPNAGKDASGPQDRLPAWLQTVDWRELATGVLVVCMALFGSDLGPVLSAHAKDILVTQLAFEFPMALLAVCAGQAIALKSSGLRTACVCLGAMGVLTAGAVWSLQLNAPVMIIGGAWLVLARISPLGGSAWFSAEHCRTIEVTAGTAWASLVVALLFLSLAAAMTTPQGSAQTPPAYVYALAWSFYYLGLALLLPYVRARYGGPKKRRPKR